MNTIINLHMIGSGLREAREKCHLTQAEMAEKLGIHTNSYGNFERGYRTAQLDEDYPVLHDPLLNKCSSEMVHQIYIALKAIQEENAQKTRS